MVLCWRSEVEVTSNPALLAATSECLECVLSCDPRARRINVPNGYLFKMALISNFSANHNKLLCHFKLCVLMRFA